MFEPLDEDVSLDLEDGEISDCEYTPLERPSSMVNPNHPVVPNQIAVLPDTDTSENDDSDNDNPIPKIKRPKIEPTPNTNNDKYKIWCQNLQDEALAATLGSCEVSMENRHTSDDRNVESYNYRPYAYNSDCETIGKRNKDMKRKHNGQHNKSSDSFNQEDDMIEERILLPLKATVESTEDELADDIANKLLEIESELVLKVVQLAGKKEAIHFFEKVKDIEKSGGMWLEHQNRRRTPGGIFFFLVKNDRHLPQGVIKTIFAESNKKSQKKQKNMKKKKQKSAMKRRNAELKAKLQDELSIISANVQNSKSSEGDSNPPPSPVSEAEIEEGETEVKMESD